MLARQYALAFNDFIHLLNAFKKLVEKYTHNVISTSHPKLISRANLPPKVENHAYIAPPLNWEAVQI